MALHRALDNDNQAFRRLGGLINRTFELNMFCFWKSNTYSTEWLLQTNMYQSWFRYRRYWIQWWSVTGDDPLPATSLY